MNNEVMFLAATLIRHDGHAVSYGRCQPRTRFFTHKFLSSTVLHFPSFKYILHYKFLLIFYVNILSFRPTTSYDYDYEKRSDDIIEDQCNKR